MNGLTVHGSSTILTEVFYHNSNKIFYKKEIEFKKFSSFFFRKHPRMCCLYDLIRFETIREIDARVWIVDTGSSRSASYSPRYRSNINYTQGNTVLITLLRCNFLFTLHFVHLSQQLGRYFLIHH